MEKEDDIGRNLLDDMPPINCDLFEGPYVGSNDIGDITFCLGNYVPDFMKVKLIATHRFNYISSKLLIIILVVKTQKYKKLVNILILHLIYNNVRI